MGLIYVGVEFVDCVEGVIYEIERGLVFFWVVEMLMDFFDRFDGKVFKVGCINVGEKMFY